MNLSCCLRFVALSLYLFSCISTLAQSVKNAPVDSNSSDENEIKRLLEKGRLYLLFQPDSSFVYGSQALQKAGNLNDLLRKADAHQLIGEVFFRQSVYAQGLEHLLAAEEIYKQLNQAEKLGDNLNQQGLLYYQMKQPDYALEHHEEALQLYRQRGNLKGVAYSLGCIGRFYEKSQQPDKALAYQREAMDIYRDIDDKAGLITILENMGSIYEDREEYTLALNYFLQSLALTNELQDSASMIVNLNNIGDMYRKTNQYQAALEFTSKAVRLAERLGDKYQVSSAYKDLSKIYSQMGNYRAAYENLELGRNLYEEIYGEDVTRQLVIMQTLFEFERKSNSILQLENEKRVNNIIKIALGSGIALLLIVGWLIFSRQRLKIKRERDIVERNEKVFNTQRQLMQTELENTHLHEKQLQVELEAKSKSLSAHTLHVIGKNKTLDEIQLKLKDILDKEPIEQRRHIKGLIKIIERSFVQDADWNDFRLVFEEVHHDFLEKLQQISNDLTPAEIRLASLMRMNMSSRDIATVLGISQDSLRIARYRLRKKLKLEQGDSLGNFILSL